MMISLKPIVVFILSISVLNQPAIADITNKEFELVVTPEKCVALRQGATCYAKVSLYWQGKIPANVCLYQATTDTALKCWQNAKEGDVIVDIATTDTAVFELKHSESHKVLASNEMRVAWVYKKKRHSVSWRIF